MNPLRKWAIPVLGMTALAALFLKLPEVPNFFGLFSCKACSSNDPFLPLAGAGYFSAIIALSLLFPAFPSRRAAKGGLLWAVLLAFALTYLHLPKWCGACLTAHACNVLIWTVWFFYGSPIQEKETRFTERLYLLLIAPVSTIALFSCLNLTFMAYGFKIHQNPPVSSLKAGDPIPHFIAETTEGRHLSNNEPLILNFISPDCPYSKEQLKILNGIQTKIHSRVIHVSPNLTHELTQDSPAEWVEDKDSKLLKLFKVKGYPTLFALDKDGKITQVIPGVPKQLESDLITNQIR